MSNTIPELADRLAEVREDLIEIQARLDGEVTGLASSCRRPYPCRACSVARSHAVAMRVALEYLERIRAFDLVPCAEHRATKAESRQAPGAMIVRTLRARG